MRMLILLVLLIAHHLTLVADAACAEPHSDSLYAVPFAWKDDSGASRALASLSGNPVVLTFAYTKCSTACPLTMQRVKKIADQVAISAPSTRFVIVSLDPENDTPATLAKFRDHYKLSQDTWHLLTGSNADVRKLAVLLGYSFGKKAGDDEIIHSNKIVGLDGEGRVVTELDGLESDTKPLVDAMVAVASKA